MMISLFSSHRKSTCFLSCLLIMLAGCLEPEPFEYTEAPKASFIIDQKDKFGAPDTVSFVNKTTFGQQFQWDFGDGKKDTNRNPVHIYEKPGKYVVKLLAKNLKASHDTMQSLTIKTDSALILMTSLEGCFECKRYKILTKDSGNGKLLYERSDISDTVFCNKALGSNTMRFLEYTLRYSPTNAVAGKPPHHFFYDPKGNPLRRTIAELYFQKDSIYFAHHRGVPENGASYYYEGIKKKK